MKATEFCYWLQGFFEITGEVPRTGLTKPQVEMIQRHLHLVFKHEIDPSYPNSAELNKIHSALKEKVKPTVHAPFDDLGSGMPGQIRC